MGKKPKNHMGRHLTERINVGITGESWIFFNEELIVVGKYFDLQYARKDKMIQNVTAFFGSVLLFTTIPHMRKKGEHDGNNKTN